MSSRFFGGGSSSSSEEYSDEDPQQQIRPQTNLVSKFGMFGDSSSDDEVRVVKSKEQKMYEAFNEMADQIMSALDSGAWAQVGKLFNELVKMQNKFKGDLRKYGTPSSFYRTLEALENKADELFADKKSRKTMAAADNKALNKTRQQVRKLTKKIAKEMDKWRALRDAGKDQDPDFGGNAAPSAAVADADSADGSDEDAGADGAKSGDGSGDDEYSYYSDDEPAAAAALAQRRNRWMMSDSDSDSDDAAAAAQAAKDRAAKRKARQAAKEAEAAAAAAAAAEEEDKVTAYDVRDIVQAAQRKRGRKGLDVQTQIDNLVEILPLAITPQRRIEVLVMLCSFQLDVVPNMFSAISPKDWHSLLQRTTEILDLLDANDHILIDPQYRGFSARTPEEIDARKKVKAPDGTTVPPPAEPKLTQQETEDRDAGIIRVSGSLRAFVERLDDEFFKSLQSMSAHGRHYVARLADGDLFVALAKRVHTRLITDTRLASNSVDTIYCAYRWVNHLYYIRPDLFADDERDASAELIYTLCIQMFSSNSEHIRQVGMCYLVTHYALFDKYYKARDMLLMSHLQDIIHRSAAEVQILFNRMMVQLGLCAFRAGLITEAHKCLCTIAQSKHIRELLAQGSTSIRNEADQAKEKIQRRRVLPAHLHINIELIECTALLTAMLLEIPNMAKANLDAKRRVIDREFRRKLSQRGPFTGLPETPRDHMVAGARALAVFDWKKSLSHIISQPCWSLLSNSAAALDMITLKIKECALTTFFYKNGRHYASLASHALCARFELPEPRVNALVSKMMISEEIHASWDEPTASVIMHKDDVSPIQVLSLQLAEKASTMVENNEKLLDDHNISFDRFNTGRSGKGRRRRRGDNNAYKGGGRKGGNKGGNGNKGSRTAASGRKGGNKGGAGAGKKGGRKGGRR